jgi:penicillin G amidase
MRRVAIALFFVSLLLLASSIRGRAGQQGQPGQSRQSRESGQSDQSDQAGFTSAVVPGLERPVQVLVDEWGVPHIYAERLYDAFAAQGFVAARDRLWQIDLWRKRGLGEMAKDLGPAWFEHDRMARAVLFRGDLSREWLAYASDAKRIAESFVAGINAYVELTERRPELLPEEFRLLDYRPARWQASDIVRIRHHGLTLNFTSEIYRAEAYCKDGPDAARADWMRRALVPDIVPKLVSTLEPCDLPFERLRKAYNLATARPQFAAAAAGAADVGADAADAADVASAVNAEGAADAAAAADVGLQGSNNWVVAPRRTATGRPVLASDPHRTHSAPSLRYISHLVAPGLNVIGAGEPFLPGISIGHNESIAFGLTRFYIDQEDLYVYTQNPAMPGDYRYKGRWEETKFVRERIEVRGEAPRETSIAFTRHGPMIAADPSKARIFALRAAWLDIGMAPYFGAIEYMRARNWDQFAAAMNRWGAPGENQVYADTNGNIGWIPAGLTVVRRNWDGLTPVPGDGDFEWDGYRDMDELPRAFNPAAGFIVTANENNIPPDHPAASKGIGYEWGDDSRLRRLTQLLASQPSHRLEDSQAMQLDTTSLPAQRIVKLLADVKASNPDARVSRALDLLRRWDGNVKADSAAAALFEVWFTNHLRRAVVRAVLSPDAAARVGAGDASRVVQVLEGHGSWLAREQRDRIIVESLTSALAEVEKRLGPDRARWQWGQLHTALFEHPLAARVDAATRQRLTVGTWPIGGSGSTPMATSYRSTTYQLTGGASFRMVTDVGNWDASVAINTPGQSGDPASPHYRDLAPLWAQGRYFPLLYSREAVETATRTRFELKPR